MAPCSPASLVANLARMRPATPTRCLRILAVDDSPLAQLLVAAALEERGFSVQSVESGLAVGRALRSDPKTRGWPIAMHTSRSEHDVRSGFRDYDVFLPKPCEHRALGDAIERLVQGKRFA